jgi:hypothetical protein
MKAKEKIIRKKEESESVLFPRNGENFGREKKGSYIFEEDKELVRELSEINPYIGKTLSYGIS